MFRRAAKHALYLADRLVPVPDGVTILIYHRVGAGTESEVDLPVETFKAQLAYLAEHADVITLDAALDRLDPPDDRRSVVVTFDDGTTDFNDHALPALVELSIPATLYVATKFVDEGVRFPWDAPPMTWDGVREAESTGLVTIGSHTHTHALLDRVDATTVDDELDRSVSLIAEHTASRPEHFAYPKAVSGSSVADTQVRRRFRSASLARSRVNRPGGSDRHRLWRTPVQRSDTPTMFARKACGGMRLEGEARELAARARYRRATS
ncbi:MAG: polysaccharide deacetylase family protein [Actinomycetota bacterium]